MHRNIATESQYAGIPGIKIYMVPLHFHTHRAPKQWLWLLE